MNKEQELAQAASMDPVQGTVEVNIPIDSLWECFRHANWWPRWNPCFFWARNPDLVLGQKLVWTFQPIKPYLPYKMFAIATIVELEARKKVTWEVSALPGFYARHTYHMEDLGGGRSRFGSYEKAMGWSFRLMKWFWIKHFTFVKDESLRGAQFLERKYAEDRRIDAGNLPPKRFLGFKIALLLLALTLGAAGAGAWMYLSFGRQVHVALAPDMHAVLGGGGNSLVLKDGGEVLLVDTKFWPGSVRLRDWIAKNVRQRVTTIVNTHYHYDHTRGNALYSGARVVAYRDVPQFMRMRERDARWSQSYPAAVPSVFVDERNRDAAHAMKLQIGGTEVLLFYPGVAHTHGDLCVFVPKHNVLLTGDLVFLGYYPFIDTSPAGASLPGMATALRKLAQDFPGATFIPGHGPLARVQDLRSYADYLEDLHNRVARAYRDGKTEDQAAQSVDLSGWHRHILPSFPDDRIWPEWATSESNVRAAYRLLQGSGQPRG